MNKIPLLHLALVAGLFSFMPLQAQTTTPAAEAKWACTAPSIVSGRYTGGDWAFIHLAAYQSGGSYKLLEKGESVVKGMTKDGTLFECKKAP